MGKSSDPPPAPDYAAAAKETAAGDLEAAKYATKANRINQVTPYGNLTYEYKPELDASGKETGGGWTQTTSLSPTAQDTVNKQIDLSNQYASLASSGLEKARSSIENPVVDMSNLPDMSYIDLKTLPKSMVDADTTAQQALLSRINPSMQEQEQQLMARLANQGITLGSDAYGREMRQFQQQKNDAIMQAALQGAQLQQSLRQQALNEQQAASANSADIRSRLLQERAYQQDRPLNLINALRSGAQVQNPQFSSFALQNTTKGPDLLGAANAQYNADMNAYNANEASSSNATSGLLSIGGAVVGGMFGGPMGASLGASLGGAAGKSLSDIRLKKNIKKLGVHKKGFGIYEFEYLWSDKKHVGVMAQEIEIVQPEAVFEIGGYKGVDYGLL